MKLTLTDVQSGYNLTPLNTNFEAIESEFQNKVLYRDNPTGEPNQMENNLDMNSNAILNAKTDLTDSGSLLTLGDADARYLNASGDTLVSDINANGFKIKNLGEPTSANDAARLSDVQASLAGGSANLITYEDENVKTALDKLKTALDKRTIYVGSVAELEALSLPVGTNVYLTQEGRAGEFVVKAGTPPSDPQKGIYIVLANGNYVKRQHDGILNVKWFGATGDGVTDDSVACQAALDAGKSVFFPDSEGSYMVDPRRVLITNPGNPMYAALLPNSDQVISFGNKATLEAITQSESRYSILGIHQKNNVTVYGGNLLGERLTHVGTTGEHGHCVHIQNSSFVTFLNTKASNGWGDGFNIDATDPTDANSRSFDVTLINCVADNNRRQGASITGCVRFTIQGGKYINTNGTDPQAGIDFEPNDIITTNEDCKVIGATISGNANFGIMTTVSEEVTVTNCYLENNPLGHFYTTYIVDLVVTDCRMVSPGRVLRIGNSTGAERNHFFSNCTYKTNSANGLENGIVTNVGTSPYYSGSLVIKDSYFDFDGPCDVGTSIPLNTDVQRWTGNTYKFRSGYTPVTTAISNAGFFLRGEGIFEISGSTFKNEGATTLRNRGGALSYGHFGAPNSYDGPFVDEALNGDFIHDFAFSSALAAGASQSKSVAYIGAKIGDRVEIAPVIGVAPGSYNALVSSDGIITATIYNFTGAAQDYSGQYNVKVTKLT